MDVESPNLLNDTSVVQLLDFLGYLIGLRKVHSSVVLPSPYRLGMRLMIERVTFNSRTCGPSVLMSPAAHGLEQGLGLCIGQQIWNTSWH